MSHSRSPARRRAIAVLIIAIAVSISAACGSNEPAGPTAASVAGRYVLATVSGQPVPVAYGSLADSFTDDAISLHGDASFDRIGHQRMLTGRGMVTSDLLDTGTFSVSGSRISFNSHKQFGMHIDGVLTGGTLTIAHVPGPFVYHRQ